MTATVSDRCDVNIVSTDPNVLFSLDQTVANVELVCNRGGELEVSFTSANADAGLTSTGNAALINTSATGDNEIPYDIDTIVPAGGNGTAIGFAFNNEDLNPTYTVGPFAEGAFLDPLTFDLRINVEGIDSDATGLFAGDYEDVITISIGSI